MEGEDLSPQEVLIAAKGIFLMNGGKVSDFYDMTLDEIHILYVTYRSYEYAKTNSLLEGLIGIKK